MAGIGKRFIDAGYNIPKYLIKVKNKTLFEWSLNSLPLELADKLIFILLEEHEKEYKVSKYIDSIFANHINIEYLFLKAQTRGQAETVYKAKDKINLSNKLIIFNIDTNFHSSTLKVNLQKQCDGLVGVFSSDDAKFSYAKTIREKVIETAEKKVISNNALTGLYMFDNPSSFFEAAENSFQMKLTINNEYYIAPLYNFLIKKNKYIIIDRVDDINILGTPSELERFKSKNIFHHEN